MSSTAFAFDHCHADWAALLKRHVVLTSAGRQPIRAGNDSPGRLEIEYLDYDWALNVQRR
jgi:hypothetical protein